MTGWGRQAGQGRRWGEGARWLHADEGSTTDPQAARAAVRERMTAAHARLADLEERRTGLVTNALDATAGRADALDALAAADARLGGAVGALTGSGLDLETVAALVEVPVGELRRALRARTSDAATG